MIAHNKQRQSDSQRYALAAPALGVRVPMRIVAIILSLLFLIACAPQNYITSPEIHGELPNDFDPELHDFVRIYTPAGSYPKKLCDTGFEGYVIVEFDIDKEGETTNLRVVESDAENEFSEIALASVDGVRYLPRVIYGERHYVSGVKTRVKFCSKRCRAGEEGPCEHRSTACE